jgi:cysteine desulfurase/selenocysteine lyase
LVAFSYGRTFLSAGDEILVGAAEHHANYLPWQILEQNIGIRRKIIPLDENYDIDLVKYEKLFSRRTKLVAIQHIGNVIGAVNDIKKLTDIAHAHGAKILIDGASSLGAGKFNLAEIGCDFFACSGHKGFAPMGSGFLFGKYELLRAMPPFHAGGNTVNRVKFEETTFKLPPAKFEAGTPDVAAIIGLGEAITFLESIDWKGAENYLNGLTQYAGKKLMEISSLQIYGTPKIRHGIFSFNLKGIHPHDVATFLAHRGIAVRAGTHCAQPLMNILGVPGTVRISLSLYNTKAEIDAATTALEDCQATFGK